MIGKIFNVLIDDVFGVPRGLSLSDDIFSLWFFAPVAQLDRVPGYGPGGRGFESLRARFDDGERIGRVAQLVRALR